MQSVEGFSSRPAAVVELKLWHHSVNFRLFSMWRITSSGFLRTLCARADSGNVSSCADSSKICSKVPGSLSVAGRDGIVSCTSSSAGGVNRHLQLLSGIVTHTNCHQGCHQHPCNKEQIFLPCAKVLGTSHARKSTRIVRTSGSLHLTRRPPSCWRRAPLALWIPRSRNGILCPGYLIGHA